MEEVKNERIKRNKALHHFLNTPINENKTRPHLTDRREKSRIGEHRKKTGPINAKKGKNPLMVEKDPTFVTPRKIRGTSKKTK